jgi:hypothetical protein
MDEIRYHSVALDNNYLQTRFNNINSQYAFWNVGSESTQPTTASSTSYTENYSYDVLGNLLSKTGEGNYAYAGNTGSSYADPDAATMIGSSTLSYDNNGNLTSSGTHGYQWDYLNRMIGAGNGTATSSYLYDAFSNRVKKTVGTTTTVYPNTLYSQSGNVITRNIFDSSGALVATVNGGTSTRTYSAQRTSSPMLPGSSLKPSTTVPSEVPTWTSAPPAMRAGGILGRLRILNPIWIT